MKRIASFGALVALFVLGLAVNGVVPGLAGIGALLGTTTQTDGGLDLGTGDFTYDGQTVPQSDVVLDDAHFDVHAISLLVAAYRRSGAALKEAGALAGI